MSSKAEKKRRGSRGGSRAPRAGRAAQAPLATQAVEDAPPAAVPEPEPQPELSKEEPEPVLDVPEVEEEEEVEPEADVKPLFLSRAVLTGLADAVWTEEHDAALEQFAQDSTQPVLTFYVDPCFGLKLDLGVPVQTLGTNWRGTLSSTSPQRP